MRCFTFSLHIKTQLRVSSLFNKPQFCTLYHAFAACYPLFVCSSTLFSYLQTNIILLRCGQHKLPFQIHDYQLNSWNSNQPAPLYVMITVH